MEAQIFTASRRPAVEMQQKTPFLLHDSFFSLKAAPDRPVSVATEFMESDFEDDEILSDVDDCENSPRASLNSGQPSFTTMSSYDEVPTPRSSRIPADASLALDTTKAVEGPRGPHLFRISDLSADFQNVLTMSPLTPKVPPSPAVAASSAAMLPPMPPLPHGPTPLPPTSRRHQSQSPNQNGPFRFTHASLDTRVLSSWTPEQVAQWMLDAGIELPVCDRFVENDITGGILITLKFEDLKELGIPSFGVRTNVWHQISAVKDAKDAHDGKAPAIAVAEQRAETPIDDEPDRHVRRELRRGPSMRRKMAPATASRHEDVISPLESVSIVGIEQMMPKPHQCSKGENCSKWRRNQRMMEAFRKDHPFVDIDKGGIILIAGDPGNPATARNINEDVFRPVSDAIPSVVASSDVMGPGDLPPPPVHNLEAESLRSIQSRDPQEHVRQFLDFQHQHLAGASEVPPTPPFEIFPARRPQLHEGLRALPKLAIPAQARHSHAVTHTQQAYPTSAHPATAHPATAHPLSSVTASAAPTSGTSYTNTAIEESPGRTPVAPYRFGTPFTEVDVPVTVVPTGPVAREVSQSVPPDMNYRAPPQRTMSRASARRPSFPVLPALDEGRAAAATATPSTLPIGLLRSASAMGYRSNHSSASPIRGNSGSSKNNTAAITRPLQPPPRVKYPWSSERASFEKAIAPLSLVPGAANTSSAPSTASSAASNGLGTPASSASTALTAASGSGAGSVKSGKGGLSDGINYQGVVKKRRTKMLRHEWNDRYVTLRGTRLAVHADRATVDRALEYVDIDDYAIACSSMASTSKLNAAFKAMNIRRADGAGHGHSKDKNKDDVAAFAFQLIPQDSKGGVRLRKRDSTMPAAAASTALGGNNLASASASASSLSNASTLTGSSAAVPPPPPDAVNGTGKTHHFAVTSRDDRIEWMRELMLAKAMRQKGEGFEISVNGNMI